MLAERPLAVILTGRPAESSTTVTVSVLVPVPAKGFADRHW